ncbi:hypothetical protein BC940DRAFT_294795 [Gongronella butleri]|nr:hypothetical protein BC940DRAFT_294795 [Gongronella butleri]
MVNKLLLVFVHGFRGSETSFKDYPNWLQSSLSEVMQVEATSVVYPSYKTAGDLQIAVENFATWILDQLKPEKHDHTDIVLIGHSMGGIVAAETIFFFQRHAQLLKGASILGLIAYDTPFYSVNHDAMSTTAMGHVERFSRFIPESFGGANNANTRTVGASSSSASRTTALTSGQKWGLLAGAVGAIGAAAVGAYVARDQISSSLSDMYGHLEFVSVLMDTNGLSARMKRLLQMPNIFFRCYYIKLPSTRLQRTFIALPPADTSPYFEPIQMTKAESEVEAHTSIFDPRKNESYYELGSSTIGLIASHMVHASDKNAAGVDLDLD